MAFHLDNNERPVKLFIIKAKNIKEAYKKMQNINYVLNNLKLYKEWLFKPFKLNEI